MGRALGPSWAHGKCPEMVCPAPGNWSIAATLGAPAEARVARGLGQQQTALRTPLCLTAGGQR